VHVTVQEHDKEASLNSPGGDDLMSKLGGKNAGLPFFAFLDARGEMLVNSLRPDAGKGAAANIGYPDKPEEIDWFLAMVHKAAPEMPAAESSAIERWLRKRDR
jgi:hypothetical protein